MKQFVIVCYYKGVISYVGIEVFSVPKWKKNKKKTGNQFYASNIFC